MKVDIKLKIPSEKLGSFLNIKCGIDIRFNNAKTTLFLSNKNIHNNLSLTYK